MCHLQPYRASPAFSPGVVPKQGTPGTVRDEHEGGGGGHGRLHLEFAFDEVTVTFMCLGTGLASSPAMLTGEVTPICKKPGDIFSVYQNVCCCCFTKM